MKITEVEDAKQYFNKYVEFIIPHVVEKNPKHSDDDIVNESISVAKSNIGYFSGYCDEETRNRVSRIFEAEHPIFGSGNPTSEEAFEMGKRFATKIVRNNKLKNVEKHS